MSDGVVRNGQSRGIVRAFAAFTLVLGVGLCFASAHNALTESRRTAKINLNTFACSQATDSRGNSPQFP